VNEIYAVDPEAPKDLQDLRSLLERFGPSNGRFVGRYPEDWISMLQDRFSSLSGLDRSRLSILIQRHRDTLMSVQEKYFRSKSWRENAKTTHQFKKILASSPNTEGLPTLEEFLWDDSEADSSRGEFIPMTIQSYCGACYPLFAISSEVHITDRFFHLRRDSGDLDRKRLNLLNSMVKLAESSGRCRHLVIHFELPNHTKESHYEPQLISDLKCLQEDTTIEIGYDIHHVLQHGRYIFSIKGGLHFDHGLQLDHAGLNHIHWLSQVELRGIHKAFGMAL
jgi:hypothetical protein